MKRKTQNQGPLWFSLLRLAEQWGWWWRAERTVQDRLLWPCITDGCSAHHGTVRSTNSTPSLSSTWLPEKLPHQYRDLTLGCSWLGQGWACNPIRAKILYLWEFELDIKQEDIKQDEFALSLRAMFTEEDKSTEGKKRLRWTQWERPGWEQQSPEIRVQVCSQDPAAFLTLVSVRHPVYPLFI